MDFEEEEENIHFGTHDRERKIPVTEFPHEEEEKYNVSTNPQENQINFQYTYEQWAQMILEVREDRTISMGDIVNKICRELAIDPYQKVYSEDDILNQIDIQMHEIEKNYACLIASHGGEEVMERNNTTLLAEYKSKLQSLRRWLYDTANIVRSSTNLVSDECLHRESFSPLDFVPIHELNLSKKPALLMRVL